VNNFFTDASESLLDESQSQLSSSSSYDPFASFNTSIPDSFKAEESYLNFLSYILLSSIFLSLCCSLLIKNSNSMMSS
jgi:hypothetical protein